MTSKRTPLRRVPRVQITPQTIRAYRLMRKAQQECICTNSTLLTRKNSTRYNRTRNFGLCGDVEGNKTEKFVFRSGLRPNQISFSHNRP
jgi:hypothetical protein